MRRRKTPILTISVYQAKTGPRISVVVDYARLSKCSPQLITDSKSPIQEISQSHSVGILISISSHEMIKLSTLSGVCMDA